MKDYTALLVAAVLLFDALAVYTVLTSSPSEDDGGYAAAIKAAEEYKEQNLCEKAINAYIYALNLKDTYDVRMEVVDLYDKGYINSEFPDLEGKFDTLQSNIELYPQEKASYEEIISDYFELSEFEDCAQYIMLARRNGIESDVVDEHFETMRHMYIDDDIDPVEIKQTSTGYMCIPIIEEEEIIEDEELTDESENAESETSDDTAAEAPEAAPEDSETEETLEETDDVAEEEPESDLVLYTHVFNDGSTQQFEVPEMSAISEIINSDGSVTRVYFIKQYGNEEEEEVLYTSVVIDGVRTFYLDNALSSEIGCSDNLVCCYNSENGKYLYCDLYGKTILEGYDDAGAFLNGVAYVKNGADISVVNYEGEAVIEDIDDIILDDIKRCSVNERMFVKYKGDSEYTLVKSSDMSEVSDFSCTNADLFVDGAAAFEQGGKWGFVDTDGKIVIEAQYEEARSFSKGMAAVKKDGKWGYINAEGEMIVEPAFAQAYDFMANGSAYVVDEDGDYQNIRLYIWETNSEG